MDGHDIRDVTQMSLRSQIGVVFQESFLFDETLRENIRLGKPEASDEEIEAAARARASTSSLRPCPRATERGLVNAAEVSQAGSASASRSPARWSAGPPYSSSTSRPPRWTLRRRRPSTDVAALAKERTVIFVTHRLTSLVADRILVLNAGRLVEDGAHEDLVALGGTYSELWRAQSSADWV